MKVYFAVKKTKNLIFLLTISLYSTFAAYEASVFEYEKKSTAPQNKPRTNYFARSTNPPRRALLNKPVVNVANLKEDSDAEVLLIETSYKVIRDSPALPLQEKTNRIKESLPRPEQEKRKTPTRPRPAPLAKDSPIAEIPKSNSFQAHGNSLPKNNRTEDRVKKKIADNVDDVQCCGNIFEILESMF